MNRPNKKKPMDAAPGTPDVEAALLSAARQVFTDEGYAKLTIRGVAAQAGFTYGAVQYYFPTKDALVEAMLLDTFDEIQRVNDEIAGRFPEREPLERFMAVMEFRLESLQTPEIQRLLFELSALATRHTFAASLMNRMFTNSRKAVRRLIRDIVSDLSQTELDLRAAAVNEVVMGLMFVVGHNRPRGHELRGLEQKNLDILRDIVTKA